MTDSTIPTIGAPATRALENAGVQDLEALTNWSEADLLSLHGMGPKAVRILREHLVAQGLDLRPRVRRATLADVDAIAAMVAAAFAPDPGWAFMIPADRADVRAAFARTLLIPRLSRRTAWVTDDCTAVAMWDRSPTDVAADHEADALWAAFRAEAGEEVWAQVEAYEAALDALVPSRPYWYLGVLATHPDHQGRGLASAVLGPGLAAADAEGWDCWLETSTPANKAFYAGRGFTDAVAVELPGGPPTWWLRRPAPAGRGSGT